MPARVVVRADAVVTTGAGHLARVLGLVDELRARGAEVVVAGDVEIPWVLDLLAERGLEPVAFPADPLPFARWCREEGALAVVLDGYDFDPGLGSALMAGGLRVLSMRDGSFGAEQACDVAVDQNLGSERRARPHEGTLLAGPRYTLFRDEILSATPVTWAPDHRGSRVLAFFGGSDPFGAAEVVAPLVLDAAAALDLRVVTADPGVADRLGALPTAPGQGVTVLAPRPDLMSLARGADLVVTATGSSVWELMVHGVAFACVQVAHNQELGYRALVTRGLCLGLGSLDDLRDDPATAARARTEIRRLSTDPVLRATLAGRGRSLFDGRGRARVADEFLPQTRESSQDGADQRRRNPGAP